MHTNRILNAVHLESVRAHFLIRTEYLTACVTQMQTWSLHVRGRLRGSVQVSKSGHEMRAKHFDCSFLHYEEVSKALWSFGFQGAQKGSVTLNTMQPRGLRRLHIGQDRGTYDVENDTRGLRINTQDEPQPPERQRLKLNIGIEVVEEYDVFQDLSDGQLEDFVQ